MVTLAAFGESLLFATSAACTRIIQDIHQIEDEAVVLQGWYTLFRQYGLLAARWAGDTQALWGDVILQAQTAKCVKARKYLEKKI